MNLPPRDVSDAPETLARLELGVRRRRAVLVEELLDVLHWADLFSADPADGPVRGGPGGERLAELGGDGTPGVQELALCELGIALDVHTLSARSLVADALDLRHRLPEVWEQVLGLDAEPWVARKVASLSRGLSVDAVRVVDAAVAKAITGMSPTRVIAVAEAKVIEADPVAHRARLDAERQRRYVGLTRSDSSGLRMIIARVAAGDAVWVDATLARVAEILAGRPEHASSSIDVLRAEAFGWLARPAELLALLLENTQPEPTEPTEPTVSRALAFPADLLGALRGLDLARLRPRTVVYVHVHEAALAGLPGVARVEGLGPHTLGQVRDLLAHAHVTVKPVIDLADEVSSACYEHPEAIKERVHLRRPGEGFPHGSSMGRHLDLDHVVPWDPHGPPDQTSTRNAQPLGRRGHRARTHLGYSVTPVVTGEVVWRTPHGLHRIVDSAGTHHLDPEEARILSQVESPADALQCALVRIEHRLRTGRPC